METGDNRKDRGEIKTRGETRAQWDRIGVREGIQKTEDNGLSRNPGGKQKKKRNTEEDRIRGKYILVKREGGLESRWVCVNWI